MNIVIVGANGLIAKKLMSCLIFKNQRVGKVSQNDIQKINSSISKNVKEDLDSQSLKLLRKIIGKPDLLILAGRSSNSNFFNYNTTNATIIVRYCILENIKIVFISSFSAFESCNSLYAQEKRFIEGLLNLNKNLIIRLPLVVSQEAKLLSQVNRLSLFCFTLIPKSLNSHQYIMCLDHASSILCESILNKEVGLKITTSRYKINLESLFRFAGSRTNTKIIYFPKILPKMILSILSFFFLKYASLKSSYIGLLNQPESEVVLKSNPIFTNCSVECFTKTYYQLPAGVFFDEFA